MLMNREDLGEEWPAWLREADWDKADVAMRNGVVHWHDGVWYGGEWHGGVWYGGEWHGGVWYDGVWHGGVWHGGVWYDGVWRSGEWHGGVWHGGEWHGGVWRSGEWYGGEWYGGVWYGGVWRSGEWHGGVWHGGVWHGGRSAPSRAKWVVTDDGENIWIGCSRFSPEQCRRMLSGEETDRRAPPADSEDWRLLARAVRASLAALEK
jgi:hypothetical protein